VCVKGGGGAGRAELRVVCTYRSGVVCIYIFPFTVALTLSRLRQQSRERRIAAAQ